VNLAAPGSSRDNAKNKSPVDFPYQQKLVEKGNPSLQMDAHEEMFSTEPGKRATG
jgi:hypothetical protein